MQNFNYNVAVVYTPEDNESYAKKREYLFKNCDNISDVDCTKLWSYQKCTNDEDYQNPFVDGDIIFIQFPYDASKYKKIIVEIVNSATQQNVDPSGIVTFEYGDDPKGTNYVNIFINTAAINFDCFFFNTYFFACVPNPGDYATCYNAKIAALIPPYKAELECYQELCTGNIFTITSEPFRKVKCEETILIHGYYPKYDCNGNYYAPFVTNPPTNSFIPQVRVMGEVVWVGDKVEETVVNRERIKARRIDTWKMRTLKIPPYVVQMIAQCFNSQKLFIGVNQYKGHLSLDKNFDEGKMWIIDTDLFTECDEIDFTCD